MQAELFLGSYLVYEWFIRIVLAVLFDWKDGNSVGSIRDINSSIIRNDRTKNSCDAIYTKQKIIEMEIECSKRSSFQSCVDFYLRRCQDGSGEISQLP